MQISPTFLYLLDLLPGRTRSSRCVCAAEQTSSPPKTLHPSQGIHGRSQGMLGYAVLPPPAPCEPCVRGEEGVEGGCGFPPLGATAQRPPAANRGKRAYSYLHGRFRRTPTHGAGTAKAGMQRTAGFCLIRHGCVSLHLPAYVCY